MADDISGKGDPVRTLQLLWEKPAAKKRGPKAKLALSEVVATAIRVADREGLSALTTRRVASDLNISPMALYTYVPGRHELLDLMLDAILAELRPPRGSGWREKLRDVANQNWRLARRHPWMQELATHRPVLGPHVVAKYDRELSAVDGIGLDEIEMDRALTLVLDYVAGAVRGIARERWVKQQTGMTDAQWWAKASPYLEQVFTQQGHRYPVASRVGAVVGEKYGAHDPKGAFEFGLEVLLDGLERVIDGKRARRRPRR